MIKKQDDRPGSRRKDQEQDEGQTTRGGAADQRAGRSGEPREKGERR
jgi:hypothetical protein